MPMVRLKNVLLHYRLEGKDGAPVVVLSNSLGTDLHMWDAQVLELSAHFQVLRYDTRGHGRSVGNAGPYRLTDLGGDILQLLDHLQFDQVHFCGISLGGITALWLALQAPGRLFSIMPCNTAARIGSDAIWAERIRQVTDLGLESIAEATMGRWFTAGFRQHHADQVEATRRMLCGTNNSAYAWCCAALQGADLRDRLHAIETPCLTISGTHDSVTPPAEGEFLRDHIPKSGYVELNAAHLSNIEAAPEFSQAMLHFFKSAH